MKQLRGVAKTLVKSKDAATAFPSISPHSPARSSPGGGVTKEEIDLLINRSLKGFSSTHKNTNLGDTGFKEGSVDATERTRRR